MISVASLLNPISPVEGSDSQIEATSFDNKQTSRPAHSLVPKVMKPSKSPAALTKAKSFPDVNYAPCEYQDEVIALEHRKYQVEPIGHIGNTARHIPYHSDKKDFQLKTGRDGFQAYHYTFRMPGDDPQKEAHIIMWDYNVGLVRTTALFKSLKHSKTMPAKVLAANPGLRDITHSITGGAIAAQGYWMPFEAAKAIAATFCYEIRYVLTPVFGLEFPDMCLEPEDPAFMRPSIDPRIVDRCTQMAHTNRMNSRESSVTTSPRSTDSNQRQWGLQWTPRSMKPKGAEDESDCGTDRALSPFPSLAANQCSGWTPVNIPRSSAWDRYQIPSPQTTPELRGPAPESPKQISPTKRSTPKAKRTPKGGVHDEALHPKRKRPSVDRPSTPELLKHYEPAEILAAKALLELHKADRELGERLRANPRRSSA